MPLPAVSINTSPFIQTMLCGPAYAYAGTWAFWPWQMTVMAIECEIGPWQRPTCVWKAPSPPFVAGLLQRTGDFWQSVIGIAASKDVPKWLVWTGAPGNQADPDTWGLQVAKLENGTWRVKGCIDSRIERTRTPRIIGDKAYSQGPGSLNPPWFEFDLNALTVQPSSDPGPGEVQTSIAGFTYDLQIDPAALSMPIPANYVATPPMLQLIDRPPQVPSLPGARKFIATRQGGTVLPTFCPNDKIDRKQVAAIVYNAINWAQAHPGQQLPITTQQQFQDVPDSNPFSTAINSLFIAELIAGKPVCDV